MTISLLLEMSVADDPDRLAVVSDELRPTTQALSDLADGGAGVIATSGCEHVAYVGTGGAILPLLLFASARAPRVFTSISYRLSADGIRALIGRLPSPMVVVDARYRDLVGHSGRVVMVTDEFLARARVTPPISLAYTEPDAVAVVLFTSGTTSAPKAVELTHNNLTSYVTGTVDFGAAAPSDAALICVPPYHIAGVSAALSNLYAGRKMVYLNDFDAEDWVRLAAEEAVTTATVVPTMLVRIVNVLRSGGRELPALRTLAYGGSKVGLPLLREALDTLPGIGFVNAYGLTETSSTVSVLTPEDHRSAHGSADVMVARRLVSVGRAVPGVEVQVRGQDGEELDPELPGNLFVRGEQVSGRYTGIGSVLDEQGWFATRDIAMLDRDGYLYIGGRADDTIIRGGENIAPAELEDVLIEHPHVQDVAVVGVDDAEWGQATVAVVVPVDGAELDPDDLRKYVRGRLRGSRTPDRVVFRDSLPTNATGKVLRREIVASLHDHDVDTGRFIGPKGRKSHVEERHTAAQSG